MCFFNLFSRFLVLTIRQKKENRRRRRGEKLYCFSSSFCVCTNVNNFIAHDFISLLPFLRAARRFSFKLKEKIFHRSISHLPLCLLLFIAVLLLVRFASCGAALKGIMMAGVGWHREKGMIACSWTSISVRFPNSTWSIFYQSEMDSSKLTGIVRVIYGSWESRHDFALPLLFLSHNGKLPPRHAWCVREKRAEWRRGRRRKSWIFRGICFNYESCLSYASAKLFSSVACLLCQERTC